MKTTRPAGADLYFFQSAVTGAIKIGRSKHVHKRLRQVQTGCPHKLKILLVLPQQGHQERLMHQRLASHRMRHGKGEWFGPDCLCDLPAEIYGLLDLDVLDWWKNYP